MKKNLIFFIFFLILLLGCNFNYNGQNKNSNTNDKNDAFTIAKSALEYIRDSKLDSLRNQLEPNVLSKINPAYINWLMDEGKKVINNSVYPQDSIVIISESINYSITGKTTVKMFSFPFQSKENKDTIKYFHVTVAKNKIYRLLLNNYAPGRRLIEPSHSETHKDNFNLQTSNLSWFRIWYDGGIGNNTKYQNETGYYAVSGDLDDLEKSGIRDKFQQVFNLLNNADFDSLDFQYMRDSEVGDPEWIYLRMKFNGEYKSLGEFHVSYFITEENGKKEVMSDYIILKHTNKTRYLLNKGKNPELANLLTQIGRFNFEGFYERYP